MDIIEEPTILESRLEELTGECNLELLTQLKLTVDTENETLSHIGQIVPSLTHLYLSGNISCIRDLGTNFKNLKYLKAENCNINDLDGISALPLLEELYLKDNNISDLTPLMTHETLNILDLQNNNISNLTCLEILSTCSSLNTINFIGNPISRIPRYRSIVGSILPHLNFLDDNILTKEEKKGVDPAYLDMISNIIKKQLENEEMNVNNINKLNNNINNIDKDVDLYDADSELTHGTEVIFSGNLSTILRARQKERKKKIDITKNDEIKIYNNDDIDIDNNNNNNNNNNKMLDTKEIFQGRIRRKKKKKKKPGPIKTNIYPVPSPVFIDNNNNNNKMLDTKEIFQGRIRRKKKKKKKPGPIKTNIYPVPSPVFSPSKNSYNNKNNINNINNKNNIKKSINKRKLNISPLISPSNTINQENLSSNLLNMLDRALELERKSITDDEVMKQWKQWKEEADNLTPFTSVMKKLNKNYDKKKIRPHSAHHNIRNKQKKIMLSDENNHNINKIKKQRPISAHILSKNNNKINQNINNKKHINNNHEISDEDINDINNNNNNNQKNKNEKIDNIYDIKSFFQKFSNNMNPNELFHQNIEQPKNIPNISQQIRLRQRSRKERNWVEDSDDSDDSDDEIIMNKKNIKNNSLLFQNKLTDNNNNKDKAFVDKWAYEFNQLKKRREKNDLIEKDLQNKERFRIKNQLSNNNNNNDDSDENDKNIIKRPHSTDLIKNKLGVDLESGLEAISNWMKNKNGSVNIDDDNSDNSNNDDDNDEKIEITNPKNMYKEYTKYMNNDNNNNNNGIIIDDDDDEDDEENDSFISPIIELSNSYAISPQKNLLSVSNKDPFNINEVDLDQSYFNSLSQSNFSPSDYFTYDYNNSNNIPSSNTIDRW